MKEAQKLLEEDIKKQKENKMQDPKKRKMIYDTCRLMDELIKAKEYCHEDF